MGKYGRNGSGGQAQNFPNVNETRPERLNSFQFNDMPPPNTLYPDVGPLPRNNYGPVAADNFSKNRPPWQRNRDNFGSGQNPQTESLPWNRGSGAETRSRDSQGWNNSGQDPSYNKQMTSSGWANRDQWKAEESERMARRGDVSNAPWSDRSAPFEKGGGWPNRPTGMNDPPIRPLVPPKSSQMDRFGGPPSSRDSKPFGGSQESHNWIDRSLNPDWNDNPPRHPDWKEKTQEQPWYGETRRPSPRPLGEIRSREENNWRNKTDRPQNYEWEQQRMQLEGWAKNHPDRSSKNNDWNNRPRDGDESRRIDGPRFDQKPVWSNPPREWGESNQRNMYNEPGNVLLPEEANLARHSGPFGPPERDFMRKRGRSPENKNVWSRLEPHSNFGDESMNKKLRMTGQPDSRISEEVLAMIERERMDLHFHNDIPPLVNQPIRPPINDLRLKLAQKEPLSSPAKEQNLYQVLFCPRSKKSKLQLSDKDQIYDRLVGELYKMAKSSDVNDLPQLRFADIKLLTRTKLAVECHDITTAKWLLAWDHGRTRVPLRKILPEDPHRLAIIGFDIKGHLDINPERMKYLLSTQNPGLDTNTWLDGEIRLNRKGKMFTYKVDGQTLRYLMLYKWELFFDLQKLYVRRLKTNFDFNPLTYGFF